MTYSWAFVIDSVPITKAVRDGETSLGGSESACLGLARALVTRGHQVHVFATKMDRDAWGDDAWGVTWIPFEQLEGMNQFFEWDVFVALRMPTVFQVPRKAKLRVLWNQDLMDVASFKRIVMGVAWALDQLVYVSDFHRTQWEDVLPELKAFGYVTKNGFDPAHLPTGPVVKDPNRIIHISRPERGLKPLLAMWPQFKADHPQAELHVCRYSSMYDSGGWGLVCQDFDRQLAAVNDRVGGITYLGELNKPQLYRAISEAAVMWYPGVATFAETSCIAAVEAQACGTAFVGSWKGALPETNPSAILIPGDPFSPEYQQASRDAVGRLLEGCARSSVEYRRLQREGRAHVEAYTYATIAAEWDAWVTETFQQRYEGNKLGVLRQLLHYDDHTAAIHVANDISGECPGCDTDETLRGEHEEAVAAMKLCERVIRGEDQTSSDYADRALDPMVELQSNHSRLREVIGKLKDCTHVLDVACGNGAFALALCRASETIRVTAIDYAAANIAAGKAAAEHLGVADRITWHCAPVWDYATHALSSWWREAALSGFDGVWCGEFLEHVPGYQAFIDALEGAADDGAQVVFTVPSGPLSEYLPRNIPYNRGHVHNFGQADLRAVFAGKREANFSFIGWGQDSPRGQTCGHWVISYKTSGAPTGERPYDHVRLTTRPKMTLSVLVLAQNAEKDLVRCLDSVWPIADEIVVGDAGSMDSTKALAEAFQRKVRVVPIAPVEDHPEGFAGARNDILAACKGDWVLWIDTDEVLTGTGALWAYLESGPFLGYAIHQNHLQLDAPMHFDRPIRLFKRTAPIQFYGCVHEQPQLGDCNGAIEPGLDITDVQIAHFGYLTVNVRRQKMLERNLPLLARDQEVFPDRRLGKVLVLRDYANLADIELERTGGRMSGKAQWFFQEAIGMFRTHFADPADLYHDLARPFYERALQALDRGTEVEYALAGKPGGLNGSHAKPKRIWVQSAEELRVMVGHAVEQAAQTMSPKPIRLDPIVPLRQPEPAREAVPA